MPRHRRTAPSRSRRRQRSASACRCFQACPPKTGREAACPPVPPALPRAARRRIRRRELHFSGDLAALADPNHFAGHLASLRRINWVSMPRGRSAPPRSSPNSAATPIASPSPTAASWPASRCATVCRRKLSVGGCRCRARREVGDIRNSALPCRAASPAC
jgi:hypothetical protein